MPYAFVLLNKAICRLQPGKDVAGRMLTPDSSITRADFQKDSATIRQQLCNNPATTLQQLSKNSARTQQQLCNKPAPNAGPICFSCGTHIEARQRGFCNSFRHKGNRREVKIFFRASDHTLNFWEKAIASLCCQYSLRIWRKQRVDARTRLFLRRQGPGFTDRNKTIS